jgi:salicylate hydroxylase
LQPKQFSNTPPHLTNVSLCNMGSIEIGWRRLSVGVIGGGIGGLSTAIALRRAGHQVTIYERNDFAGEAGASVSCAANGTRWLHEWGVDVQKGDPVVLKKLINRDWKTGEPVSVYDLEDYEERWGYVYNMFHRQYMHKMLMDTALQEEGDGTPVQLLVNHPVSYCSMQSQRCPVLHYFSNNILQCESIDVESSEITFSNGVKAQHDLIVGADGIGSVTRKLIGVVTEKRPARKRHDKRRP